MITTPTAVSAVDSSTGGSAVPIRISGRPIEQQRGRMAGAPDRAEARGRARAALVAGDERGDRHQVVGVGGVTEPEQERDAERDGDRRALEQARQRLVEVLDGGEEGVEVDHRVASQSGQAPTSGKCEKSQAKPVSSCTVARRPARSAGSSGTWRPQRSHAA